MENFYKLDPVGNIYTFPSHLKHHLQLKQSENPKMGEPGHRKHLSIPIPILSIQNPTQNLMYQMTKEYKINLHNI